MTANASAAAVKVDDMEAMNVNPEQAVDSDGTEQATVEIDMNFYEHLPNDKKVFLKGKFNEFMRKFRPLLNKAALAIDKKQSVQEFLDSNSKREDSDEYAANLMNSDNPVLVELREKALDRLSRGGFLGTDKSVNHLMSGEKGKFFDEVVGNAAPWARTSIEEGTRRHVVRGGTTLGLPIGNVAAVPSHTRWSHLTAKGVIAFYDSLRAREKTFGRHLLIGALGSVSIYGLFHWMSEANPDWVGDFEWPLWLTYQASKIIDMLGLSSTSDLAWASAMALGVAGIIESLRRSLVFKSSFHALDSRFVGYEREVENGWGTPTVEAESGKHDIKKNKENDILRVVYNETVIESQRRAANGTPYFNIARSLGIMLSRGAKLSPWDGQAITMDGDSCRQNWGIIGGTGEGKTSRVIIPLFRTVTRAFNIISATRFGMFIVDPKGGLHEDLKRHIPKNRLADYDVIGVRPEQAAIDLFDGMTPDEVKALVKAVAAKTIGGGGDDKVWIETASLLFGSAAWMVKYVIDKGHEEEFFGPLNCRGFSLKGLFSVAADDTLNARIADFIIQKHNNLPGSVPLKVLESANYYIGSWRSMADGTRESVRMSLTSTFGAIVSDEQLCSRFASGVFDAANDNGVHIERPRMRKISDVLNGAIFGIALGSTSSPGNSGTLVMHLLKGRLYQEANKRLADAKLARSQLELVKDLESEEVKKLHDSQFEIGEVRAGIVAAIEAYADDIEIKDWDMTRNLFLSRVPFLDPQFAETVKSVQPDINDVGFRDVLFEMSHLTNRQADSIDRQLSQYTDELRLVAWGEDPAELERLIRVAQAPEKNLCLVVIDEAQEVLSGGDDPICDEVFLAKARETGVFVLAATQSVSHLNSVLRNHDSTKSILNNLTNMIVLSTKDAPTIEYISKVVGSTSTYDLIGSNVKALFSHVEYQHPNTPAELERYAVESRSFLRDLTLSVKRALMNPLRQLEQSQSPFFATSRFSNIEVGSHSKLMKMGIRSGREEEVDDQRALHDRLLREEEEKKKLLQATNTVSLIKDSDLLEFQQGVAFVMLKNANRTVYDFAHFAYFNNKIDGDGNVSVYYDPEKDDELKAEWGTLDEAMERAAEAA